MLDASVRVDTLKPTRENAKGYALPLLLDLSRKRFLLNDSSVGGATFKEAAILLLNPSRGSTAAHRSIWTPRRTVRTSRSSFAA